jgi:type IX secretion system PorP/SprF family membrane protein
MMKFSAILSIVGVSAMFLVIDTVTCSAQSNATLTQYFQLPFLYNPAFSGIEASTDIKVGYRKQWSSFSNAPKRYFAGINHRLGKIDQSEKKGKKMATKVTHGAGAFILRESVGAIQHTQLNASYATHIPLSSTTRLASGASVRYNQIKTNVQEYIARDKQDGIYQSLINAEGRLNYGSVDWGMVLYTSKIYLGYAAAGLVSKRMTSEMTGTSELNIGHSMFMSYIGNVNSTIEIIPSVLAQYEDPIGLSYGVNIKARYKALLWTGVGYRNNEAISFLFGLTAKNSISFSYSYDMNTGEANNLGAGSHELIAGYTLFKTKNKKSLLW